MIPDIDNIVHGNLHGTPPLTTYMTDVAAFQTRIKKEYCFFQTMYYVAVLNFLNNYIDYDHGTPFPFLTFEHTDGLNYINTEISRVDDFSKIFGITNTDVFQVNLTEGVGGGFLFPKTNAQILGYKRHDDFHVSGYGVSAKVGLNLTFFKHYFIQGELKGGYINMPDIRTTAVTNDTASQHFMFLERVISFGGIFII